MSEKFSERFSSNRLGADKVGKIYEKSKAEEEKIAPPFPDKNEFQTFVAHLVGDYIKNHGWNKYHLNEASGALLDSEDEWQDGLDSGNVDEKEVEIVGKVDEIIEHFYGDISGRQYESDVRAKVKSEFYDTVQLLINESTYM